ncbi:DNA resolvase [Burkholderia ubonensis]|uniref:recombinase family protein n=1 Tax=Burkholderia ubonensis TaxID=101571 RepID=UPI0007578AD2|nr:recombinase family protein [Burkholderia ubonensis]KVA73758.1 DNA resolvase [Burkholderia ubonensis]KVH80939.1 DNA resolvase [Burkholderia ubonensis]KVM08944.1 DNA resolvase [Burkholderia ubonensis]KVM15370.1 DNA resolvase [Burkholderia ubonensis]KVM45054.1 DNA resolvase [Burkholderia ubonensis]
MTQLGYARVSTEEQCLDLQFAALNAAGCVQIFTDHGISGSAQERPGLRALLNVAQPGDTLVVWRLDRLGRSLSHLIQLMADLQDCGVDFQSLNEAIDTRTPTGRFMFHMIAALAEFERALIAERTRAGMSAARQRGQRIGRPRALTPDQVGIARQMIQRQSMEQVADHFNVHAVTMRRYLQQQMD